MMMKTVRNLTFVGLLATVHLTGGMDLAGGGALAAAGVSMMATSCDIEPYGSNPEYVGECPFAFGCSDAFLEAMEFCGTFYYVSNFWCVDPEEPPTTFSFNCELWVD